MEIRNPEKLLPANRHVIELIRSGLSSLIKVNWTSKVVLGVGGKLRECVLWTAVRDVAPGVIKRAQVLVYSVLADSIMRSLE